MTGALCDEWRIGRTKKSAFILEPTKSTKAVQQSVTGPFSYNP